MMSIGGTPGSDKQRVITGSRAFTTEGLGITPSNKFGLIQCSEKPEESAVLGSWFTGMWSALPSSDHQNAAFLSLLQELADSKAPPLVYYLTLFQVFNNLRRTRRGANRQIRYGYSKHHSLEETVQVSAAWRHWSH